MIFLRNRFNNAYIVGETVQKRFVLFGEVVSTGLSKGIKVRVFTCLNGVFFSEAWFVKYWNCGPLVWAVSWFHVSVIESKLRKVH